MEAERTQTNVFRHLGESVLLCILDTPFPQCIVLDYLHVTLLGHAKNIILAIYRKLRPVQRDQFNAQVKNQNFPRKSNSLFHSLLYVFSSECVAILLVCFSDFFNRKMRSVDCFAFVKGTEVRNLLFYGLLSHLDSVLPIEQLAHLALYVCMIRLLHYGHIFGERTSEIANRLFTEFYKDHELFYDGLQPFKLHLHSHYARMYDTHGALSNVNCFGPEDLIGSVSVNNHGTRYYGESITYYYNIDFHLQNKRVQTTTIDGPHDLCQSPASKHIWMSNIHADLCECGRLDSCCTIYRRFIIHGAMFHSLIYQKRQNSISYFVQYLFGGQACDRRFGKIELFFTCAYGSYAVIRRHHIARLYSDWFKSASYYFLVLKPLDTLYFVLEKDHRQLDLVQTNSIVNHCIVIEKSDHLFVTPFSSYHEHD